MLSVHLWTVAAASLCSLSCALLGTYLVLRKLSLLGDAISHAILPGLALAFLLTGSRNPLPMFFGAALFGLATAFISQFLTRFCRVDQGASLGVVFTTFFALGVLLIRMAADHIDLDPGCVLYGLLEYTPLYTVTVLGVEIPRSIVTLAPMLCINLLFISILYKELQITAFDPALATTVGINATLVHALLLTAVAGTSVASFESVGSILVVAMFIIPPATARLLTDRLLTTLVLSGCFGILSACGGYWGAVVLNTSVAGMMSVVAAAMFFTAFICSPRYGVIGRAIQRMQLQLRVLSEDILGLAFRCQEESFVRAFPLTPRNIVNAMGGGLMPRLALRSLLRSNLLTRGSDGVYALTSSGEDHAKRIVRTHRLWETFLVQHLKLSPDHVHQTATTLEHYTTPEMEGALQLKTGGAAVDPHGKAIP